MNNFEKQHVDHAITVLKNIGTRVNKEGLHQKIKTALALLETATLKHINIDELTHKQAFIVSTLLHHDHAMTPTEIGRYCGVKQGQESAWACKTLKSLVKKGVVFRSDDATYDLVGK